VWWVRDLAGFRQVGSGSWGIPEFAGLSDGPYKAHHLQAKLLGRVVGFAETSLGGFLAPAAGWENEAEGNAAFDAGEYLDEMIATGHKPYLLRGRDGHMTYGEMMPEKAMTDDEHKRMIAARTKYCLTSQALVRVKVECQRRGIVDH
jgi:hypothetical protein